MSNIEETQGHKRDFKNFFAPFFDFTARNENFKERQFNKKGTFQWIWGFLQKKKLRLTYFNHISDMAVETG